MGFLLEPSRGLSVASLQLLLVIAIKKVFMSVDGNTLTIDQKQRGTQQERSVAFLSFMSYPTRLLEFRSMYA